MTCWWRPSLGRLGADIRRVAGWRWPTSVHREADHLLDALIALVLVERDDLAVTVDAQGEPE